MLDEAGLADQFRMTLSTEEVRRGKPAPDVYLQAAKHLGVSPERCAGVEDSANGLRALAAAGMHIVAVPNPQFPPDEDALAGADVVISSLNELTVEVIGDL